MWGGMLWAQIGQTLRGVAPPAATWPLRQLPRQGLRLRGLPLVAAAASPLPAAVAATLGAAWRGPAKTRRQHIRLPALQQTSYATGHANSVAHMLLRSCRPATRLCMCVCFPRQSTWPGSSSSGGGSLGPRLPPAAAGAGIGGALRSAGCSRRLRASRPSSAGAQSGTCGFGFSSGSGSGSCLCCCSCTPHNRWSHRAVA